MSEVQKFRKKPVEYLEGELAREKTFSAGLGDLLAKTEAERDALLAKFGAAPQVRECGR